MPDVHAVAPHGRPVATSPKPRHRQDKDEARSQAYREFMTWARIEICDSVMRYGFQNVESQISRILQVYRNFEKEHPL